MICYNKNAAEKAVDKVLCRKHRRLLLLVGRSFHEKSWKERYTEGRAYFEVEPRTRGMTGKGECRMTLSELLALLTLLVAAAALMVEVAKAGFDIAWKVAHDRSNDDNKKSK